mgnify:CR=1 FL=1
MGTVAGTAAGLRKLDYDRMPQVAVLSAGFFVASLVHVPIGPTNVHLVLNGLVGLFLGWTLWILAPLTWIWGFFVVADSAQFSALVTEVAPSEAVGTALTLQTSLGFLLTMVTIQGLPLLTGTVGWAWAFPGLALGPVAGILAIRRLARARSGL